MSAAIIPNADSEGVLVRVECPSAWPGEGPCLSYADIEEGADGEWTFHHKSCGGCGRDDEEWQDAIIAIASGVDRSAAWREKAANYDPSEADIRRMVEP